MDTQFKAMRTSNIAGVRDNLSRGYVQAEAYQSHAELWDMTRGLDPQQLFLMADYYESQSMALRARAVWMAQKSAEDASSDRRMDYVRVEGPRAVRRFLRRGYALKDALVQAAAVTGILMDTVDWHWRAWLRDKSDQARAQRANLIYDMAQIGRTDAEIGKAVSLHEKSVARLLKDLRQQRGLTRTAAFGQEHAQQAQEGGDCGSLNTSRCRQRLAGLRDKYRGTAQDGTGTCVG